MEIMRDEYDKCYFCKSYDEYEGCEYGCENKTGFEPNHDRIIAKAKEKRAHKAEGLTAIIQLIGEWLIENYSEEDPEAVKKAIDAVDVEELVDSLDELVACMRTLNKMSKRTNPTEKKVIKKKIAADPDTVFDDLFKMMNW